jgi:NADP-reducing hydrogenase subunit HndC
MSEPTPLPTPEADAAVTPIMAHPLQRQVLVCTARSCAANGSEAVLEAFKAHLSEAHLLYNKHDREAPVQCVNCGSVGFCAIGPAVIVYPDGIWYAHVTPADVPEIVSSHLQGGRPVERLVRKRWPE